MQIRDSPGRYLNNSLLSEKQKIQSRFDRAAHSLMKHGLLSVDDRRYSVTEIEFCYHSGIHPDPFVHRHPNQSKTGWWYFHDVGQDLTFGDQDSHGGILIRALKSIRSILSRGWA